MCVSLFTVGARASVGLSRVLWERDSEGERRQSGLKEVAEGEYICIYVEVFYSILNLSIYISIYQTARARESQREGEVLALWDAGHWIHWSSEDSSYPQCC